MPRLRVLILVALAGMAAAAQDVPLEYRVKAAYLYNFVKYVEWPATAASGPITICVAGRNPFGSELEDMVKNERLGDRSLVVKVILEPTPGCHVLFVPQGSAMTAYLRAARGTPTLTVGETDAFIRQGGMVAFYPDGTNVRFAINPDAAQRAQLRISARLLQLARIASDTPEPR